MPSFSGEIIKKRYVVGDKITIELIFFIFYDGLPILE